MVLHAIQYIKKHKKLIPLIILGSLFQLLVFFPSGTHLCIEGRCGLHFWAVNSHDAMWHLELMNTAFRQFPFIMPTFAGATLSGYNMFMDLVIYLLSFSGMSTLVLFFKVLPLV
ncbi:hypothetical protein KC726_04945 [Candidatus Woesebacteria bacterium]|nr:hypothetical protein [Candidatus Woesebacteria bacterium]